MKSMPTKRTLTKEGPAPHCANTDPSNLVKSWPTPDVEQSLAQTTTSSTSQESPVTSTFPHRVRCVNAVLRRVGVSRAQYGRDKLLAAVCGTHLAPLHVKPPSKTFQAYICLGSCCGIFPAANAYTGLKHDHNP